MAAGRLGLLEDMLACFLGHDNAQVGLVEVSEGQSGLQSSAVWSKATVVVGSGEESAGRQGCRGRPCGVQPLWWARGKRVWGSLGC